MTQRNYYVLFCICIALLTISFRRYPLKGLNANVDLLWCSYSCTRGSPARRHLLVRFKLPRSRKRRRAVTRGTRVLSRTIRAVAASSSGGRGWKSTVGKRSGNPRRAGSPNTRRRRPAETTTSRRTNHGSA